MRDREAPLRIGTIREAVSSKSGTITSQKSIPRSEEFQLQCSAELHGVTAAGPRPLTAWLWPASFRNFGCKAGIDWDLLF